MASSMKNWERALKDSMPPRSLSVTYERIREARDEWSLRRKGSVQQTGS